MNESLYNDINQTLSGIAAVEPILQASEGQNVTMTMMGRSFTRLETEYTIEGIPLTSDLVITTQSCQQILLQDETLRQATQALSCLAKTILLYFNAKVGDTVTILDQDFTVVGIHGTTANSDRLTSLHESVRRSNSNKQHWIHNKHSSLCTMQAMLLSQLQAQ